jgi:hypothetical protein
LKVWAKQHLRPTNVTIFCGRAALLRRRDLTFGQFIIDSRLPGVGSVIAAGLQPYCSAGAAKQKTTLFNLSLRLHRLWSPAFE